MGHLGTVSFGGAASFGNIVKYLRSGWGTVTCAPVLSLLPPSSLSHVTAAQLFPIFVILPSCLVTSLPSVLSRTCRGGIC